MEVSSLQDTGGICCFGQVTAGLVLLASRKCLVQVQLEQAGRIGDEAQRELGVYRGGHESM